MPFVKVEYDPKQLEDGDSIEALCRGLQPIICEVFQTSDVSITANAPEIQVNSDSLTIFVMFSESMIENIQDSEVRLALTQEITRRVGEWMAANGFKTRPLITVWPIGWSLLQVEDENTDEEE